MQGQNNYRYSSAEMDKWIEAAQKATTAAALKEAYSHIQDIWARRPSVLLSRAARLS